MRLIPPPTGTAISRFLLIALAVSWTASGLRGAAPASTEPFWSFQPPQVPALPEVKDSAWVQSPIDRFVLAKLEANGLRPAPPAERRTLLRRATFDLTGLPPTWEELEAFAADPSPQAFERVLERLLASPQYGERWGRHWLDVARYADSNGQDENKAIANAFRYRDYVINAFNQDKPFDQFIREQLAGDLLPAASDQEAFSFWTATGFLVLGPKMLAEQDKEKLVMDVVDEQIDVVTRAFLGLTVSCARCHDHKFEPISTRDYYALAGIFKSTRTMANLDFVSKWNERPLVNAEVRAQIEQYPKEVEANQKALTELTNAASQQLVQQWRGDFRKYLLAARAPDISSAQAPGAPPAQLNPLVLERLSQALAEAHTDSRSVFHLWRRMIDIPAADFSLVFPRVIHEIESTPLDQPSRYLAEQIKECASLEVLARRYEQIVAESESTPTGPVVKLGPGRLGSALLADGTTFNEIPHAAPLEPSQFTLEAWVRVAQFPKQNDKRRWIAAKNPNEQSEGHYALVLDGDQAGAYLNIGGGAANAFSVWSEAGSIETNRWHHLAALYDGAELRFYLDGALAGQKPVGKPRVPGSGNFVIGRRPDGFVYFNGLIDEVRLYDRVLTASELAARAARPDLDLSGAVGSWSFNELSPDQQRALARSSFREVFFGPQGILALPAHARDFYPESTREKLAALEAERDRLRSSAPPKPDYALCVAEGPVADLPVHLRGSHLTPDKEAVPRGFLEVIDCLETPDIPNQESGRRQLAEWLTDPNHPLTARVIVNRVWQWHFGRGLVRSPDNFGLQGEPPTHPELLDWLARQFIEQGWSIKQLHRLLMLSSAYQMSTQFSAAAAARDPENQLLWRMNRRRLEAEETRDALLFLGGQLDLKMGGTLLTTQNNEYVRFKDYESNLRTVYLPIVRDRVYDVLTILDFANPSVTTSERVPTVVAHQALFFMNSPLARQQAKNLARLLLARPGDEAEDRVRAAYQLILTRPASERETEQALEFLAEASSIGIDTGPTPEERSLRAWQSFCQTLLACNEFVYLD